VPRTRPASMTMNDDRRPSGRLEEDIRRLKIEFDVYFNGGNKRAPVRY